MVYRGLSHKFYTASDLTPPSFAVKYEAPILSI